MSCTPRYFIRKDGSVNEQEFGDWTKPLVHVDSNLGEDTLRAINVPSVSGMSLNYLDQKINELKFVTGNVDIENGATPSGVTAASAIAALRENSGRGSKDFNRGSYRAYQKLITMIIERIRQFYDLPRQFRIVGERGQAEYVTYSNAGLQPQDQGMENGVDMGYRVPVLDVDVRAQRETIYTKTAQNELAIQLYQLGVFNPQQVDMSLMLLDMMDFKGREELLEKVQETGNSIQLLQQLGQISLQLAEKVSPDIAAQIAQLLSQNPNTVGIVQQASGMPRRGNAMTSAQRDEKLSKMYEAEQSGTPGATKQGETLMNKAAEQVANASRPEA